MADKKVVFLLFLLCPRPKYIENKIHINKKYFKRPKVANNSWPVGSINNKVYRMEYSIYDNKIIFIDYKVKMVAVFGASSKNIVLVLKWNNFCFSWSNGVKTFSSGKHFEIFSRRHCLGVFWSRLGPGLKSEKNFFKKLKKILLEYIIL